ncbi:MAG TPA: MoaD/ThiS family protein [Candidatus Dormibacteraeota bacterium]|nr:MoaD/ThiS family protein [Candidatus Dormibacteraeota bacterium]
MSETRLVLDASYRLKLIGVLGTAAGKREMEIEGEPGLALSDLISTVVAQVNNRQFTELLIDSATNSPLPNVIILLNDQDCNLFEGLKTRLEPGTLVTIIPVAHGG